MKINQEHLLEIRKHLRSYIEPTKIAEFNTLKEGKITKLRIWYIPHSTIYQVIIQTEDSFKSHYMGPDLERAVDSYNRLYGSLFS